MAKIPEFLLRSLYVKGSLANIDGGFEFHLRNELGPARVIGAHPLMVDRKPISIVKSFFIHGENTACFKDVTPDNSVLMHKGEALTVRIMDNPLRQGRHSLGISFVIKDIGPVSFTVSDRLR